MSYHGDGVKYCSTFGHLYLSTIVQRCPHTEGYWWRVAVWRDEDDGQPTELFDESEECGPFDSLDYVAQRVHAATVRGMHVLTTSEPVAGATRHL
jgi:hypothetical protein